ncbi:MAG TPA: hypothetical protein VEJ63_05570 [Planctomycetota bacterium]|nr:hypothetical protein [Planctomycetota bacterium]
MSGRFTAEEKVAELRREIAMRVAVYPKLIMTGKLRGEDAERRIEILREIAIEYERKRPDLFAGTAQQ